ncbi:unnamed protein product [Periconia digitata]|uniref:Helicase C-terminal domain-containing protein n=1 Tax=Periconia digitata TaxID=1303443 RepID=A0A9W4U3E6_9PLEO|nr:unnamed protein product [Periconia digitata]
MSYHLSLLRLYKCLASAFPTLSVDGSSSVPQRPNDPFFQRHTALVVSMVSIPYDKSENEDRLRDLRRYIALGCLHYECDLKHVIATQTAQHVQENVDPAAPVTADGTPKWEELHPDLPPEVKLIIGDETTRLLEAHWIRLFLHVTSTKSDHPHSILRVHLLPEDWANRIINRTSQSLKSALRKLLAVVDISSKSWHGDYAESKVCHFDPWAGVEDRSLFYLFNQLPSPNPQPHVIKNRFARNAVELLLDFAESSSLSSEEDGFYGLEGLQTKLYPYQARSASLMIQREASPQLQLDPRLEIRRSPTGEEYYFGARDGSFLHEPKFYETNRGGILAETMGLGKTIMCLSVILATRGHLPQIPPIYRPPPRVRNGVGSLIDMAASTLGRNSIPARDVLEREEIDRDLDLTGLKDALQRNLTHYEIPPDMPRMNRNTTIPPPRQLFPCSCTIVVVPRNLLHQWQSEIRKHISKDSLKILVVDIISKRGKPKNPSSEEDGMEFRHELPGPTELMRYDVLLFTRPRFEQEIQDGADEKGRRSWAGAPLQCQCPYIGSSRVRDCNCGRNVYESPLKKCHFLRIIIDEGHSFSSSVSNAVLVAKQIQTERRWVVSGTPAKNLVGVEMDLLAMEEEASDESSLRERAIEQRKTFRPDNENKKAAKALGTLASNFLMVRPWSDSSAEGKLDWDEYIYRHEHHYRKTYSGFSSCFLRTLQGLVIKTRPEDVNQDIRLPSMTHRVVYLKPCWFDKMTANLFIQVLRANAITSERSDVDYLFHKNSVKARHSLIRNLRQSNFTWTGFSLEDVTSTLETSRKYLDKAEKECSVSDAQLLLESSSIVAELTKSESWIALSTAHEVGMAVQNFPKDCEKSFSLAYPDQPSMIGITQLLDGQLHIDSHILSENPSKGLDAVGQAAKAKIAAIAEAEDGTKETKDKAKGDIQLVKAGVPSSCVGSQPVTSRRAAVTAPRISPTKATTSNKNTKLTLNTKQHTPKLTKEVEEIQKSTPVSPIRPRKRRLTLSDEMAQLPNGSPLRETRVVGTTSAKLSYLITKVVQHQATEKIIIFYDGDNAAFYIAQCLEMLYINHRIYARTLDNTRRSEYVGLFNENPDIRVLLIDVACGALGLNLNAASVVLIVNPINRPEIQAQAIKRAHRIGQTKEVLVETLVLEGTMEEAIFNRAKNMSRQQHQEAKELEDDEGITEIIQNAKILAIEPGEDEGAGKFAPLQIPQQVFGRPGREKYHRFGVVEEKEKAKKKPKTSNISKSTIEEAANGAADNGDGPIVDPSPRLWSSQAVTQSGPAISSTGVFSIFGGDLE